MSTLSPLPNAPWIYINDASSVNSDVISALAALIPKVVVKTALPSEVVGRIVKKAELIRGIRAKLAPTNPMDTAVWIFEDKQTNVKIAAETASKYHEASIKHGCNFVSVNLTKHCSQKTDGDKIHWGANHVDLHVAMTEPGAAAEKIFKWLFKTLTVPETLHLIPEKDMLAVNPKESYPGYTYCAISDMSKHPKNAKIHFIALVATKPQVGADGRLRWKVIDRTGEATFIFKYRGPEYKSAWDWIMTLQPGDRKTLPRLPMVHVKEAKRVRILKAPFRSVAALAWMVGHAISEAGNGLIWVSDKLSMGPIDGKWVAEADIEEAKKMKGKNVEHKKLTGEKKEAKIFNEKGERMWKADDDDASTTTGSVMDVKVKEGSG